jgi:hypothetical protein
MTRIGPRPKPGAEPHQPASWRDERGLSALHLVVTNGRQGALGSLNDVDGQLEGLGDVEPG